MNSGGLKAGVLYITVKEQIISHLNGERGLKEQADAAMKAKKYSF